MSDYQKLVNEIRGVTYEPQFDDELVHLKDDFFRADEFIQGAEWVLCRKPESGSRMSPDSQVWGLPVAADCGFPSVMIFYTFDDRHVWIKARVAVRRAGRYDCDVGDRKPENVVCRERHGRHAGCGCSDGDCVGAPGRQRRVRRDGQHIARYRTGRAYRAYAIADVERRRGRERVHRPSKRHQDLR